jgi:glycosyltransferase involved in cell wall biosynthesis
MKIAMVGQKGIPASFGGIERHVEELSTRLVALGHEVTVYCRPYYTTVDGSFKGVRIRKLPSVQTKHLDTISHTFLASVFAAAGRFDIVHYHGIGPSSLCWIPRLTGRHVVATVHALDWRQRKWGAFAKRCLKLGETSALVWPDRTIAVSRELVRQLEERHPGSHPVYTPNGAVVGTYREPCEMLRLGIEKGRYILTVGTLIPDRGIQYLIDAFNPLDTDFRLVIVGGAHHTKEYAESLKRTVDGRTVFAGWAYGSLLQELYANCYMYVHPSEIEGLPISLLEAMAHGRCVVTSDIPENLEAQAGCGASFRSRDAADLREKIRSLLDDPQKVEAMGRKAREHIAGHHNWDRIASLTERVYIEALRD